MARSNKQGLEYFPLDVYMDTKFKFIEMKYGIKGFGTVIRLLQTIYQQGYWCRWGEDEQLIFSHENNIPIEDLSEIANECFARGIFNKELFKEHGILTSRGIQKRYQEIVRRRKDVEVTAEYLLIDGDMGVNANTMSTPCQHHVGKSTQSKVKESKVKESKEDNTAKSPVVPYQKIMDIYHETCKDYPKIIKTTDKRKQHIAARYKEYGEDIEVFEDLFTKAQKSDFLKGNNDRDWQADFDWMMNQTNMAKVLEGKYDKLGGKNNARDSTDNDEIEIPAEFFYQGRKPVD